MDLGLNGRRALVTGSTAGIGYAIAHGLAAEGAQVTITGRTQASVDAALERLWKDLPNAVVQGVAADCASADGAKAVFAYASGDAAMILDGLFKGTRSMDDIFEIVGRERRPYYGFVGFSDYYEPSSRVPGNTIHIDPGVTEGYLRAITGELSYTTDQWRGTPTQ